MKTFLIMFILTSDILTNKCPLGSLITGGDRSYDCLTGMVTYTKIPQ